MTDVTLHLGDCLEIIPTLPPQSVDAILTDLPYGTTACSWDEVIPFEPMWAAVKHVLKPRGVFVTTASQPFTSRLVCSNLDWFKYEWIWEKSTGTRFLDAKRRPLLFHENIIAFSENGHKYNPQMWMGDRTHSSKTKSPKTLQGYRQLDRTSPDLSGVKYPRTIVKYVSVNSAHTEHPTQKPVSLYTYLALTYTNEGDTVLDMCAGSGTTGVAAVQLGRNFIGIEKRQDYFEIMQRRIKQAQMQLRLEL